MIELFSEIEAVLEGVQDGWCSRRKAYTLAGAVMALRPRIAVEIGTYAGRSFFPVAIAMKHVGKGVAVGIDAYDAEVSATGETGANRDYWLNNDHARIERNFHTVLAMLDLQGCTRIIRAPSASVVPPEMIGLLHIDGQHKSGALDDTRRFAANVELGGLVCLDDMHWEDGKVQESADLLEKLGFAELYRVTGPEESTGKHDDWAMFQRIDFA